MFARRSREHCFPRSALHLSPFIFAMLALPSPAAAYVGPGAGLTAIGIVVALIAAVVLALVGFVWYPLRRLMGKGSTEGAKEPTSGESK